MLGSVFGEALKITVINDYECAHMKVNFHLSFCCKFEVRKQGSVLLMSYNLTQEKITDGAKLTR
jgi:hypothetical protein